MSPSPFSRATTTPLPSEEELIASDIENFRNSPWGDGIADRLRTGRLENLELTLSPEKPYYFYAYGLNEDGTVTSDHIAKIEITVPPRPEIVIAELELQPVDDGRVTLNYSITHPAQGAEIQITPREEWVHDFSVSAQTISFTVDSNADAEPGSEPRRPSSPSATPKPTTRRSSSASRPPKRRRHSLSS